METKDGTLIQVGLDNIKVEGMETRAGIREAAVEDYEAVLESGGWLDPATVFITPDGEVLLAAGRHRYEAHRRAGYPRMPCLIRRGTQWDAIEFGIRDNAEHKGERLTAEDKRHNVQKVLEERPGMSDRAIAELCGVSASTVGKHRGATVQSGQSSERIGRDGRTYKHGEA